MELIAPSTSSHYGESRARTAALVVPERAIGRRRTIRGVGIIGADVERVRRATDLVGLAREHIWLRRVGKNYVGLCPLQPQRNPSFNVNPTTQRFLCFECDARGDAIEFACQIERINRDEAVKLLAARAGIALQHDAGE